MPKSSELQHVLKTIGVSRNTSRLIPAKEIRQWMISPDIDVQGSVYDFVMDSDAAQKIAPPLTFEDFHEFIPAYLLRCIAENPQSEYALDQWGAANDFANWFGSLWRDSSIDRAAIVQMKRAIEQVILHGSPAARDALIKGALEHLFEQDELREFFADWKPVPGLSKAFEAACEWSRKGGRSTLGKPTA